MRKEILVAGIAVTLFILSASFILAENISNSTISTKNWTKVCSKINDIVSQKIQMFEGGKVKRINAYNNTEDALQKLITRLDEKGADTSQAQSDYQNLQNMINKFNSDYSAFVLKLESLKSLTCGNSSGQFAAALRDTKSMLPVLRNESLQVREVAMKVRTDIVQARQGLVASKLGQRTNRTAGRIANLGNRPK